MSDQAVDARSAAFFKLLLAKATGGTTTQGAGAGAGANAIAPSTGVALSKDGYERAGKPVGFHGPVSRSEEGGGDASEDTSVQPGQGDMTAMLTQEFGSQAVMLLQMLSGTGGAGGMSNLLGGGGGLGGLLGGGGGIGALLGGGGGGGGGLEAIIEELLGGDGGDGGDGGLGSVSSGANYSVNSGVGDASVEPELMMNATGTEDQGTYVSLSNATLWGDGTMQTVSGNSELPLSDQIEQGGAGDCYFMSTLASVAAGNPQSVKDMVRPDPNGVAGDYQVRFYEKDQQTGKMQAEWVSVDDKLPVGGDGKTLYDHVPLDAQGQPCIGMALIEKAYAKFNDEHQDLQKEGVSAGAGYDGIGEGGTGAEALEAITGQNATILGGGGYETQSAGSSPGLGGRSLIGQGLGTSSGTGEAGSLSQTTDQQTVLKALQQSNPPNHQPVTAGTVGTGGVPDANGIPRLAGGLIPGHQYSVFGTYTDHSGQTMVTLRNPWGGDAKGGPGADSQGVFSVSLDQFTKDFGTVVTQSGTSSSTQSSTQNASLAGNSLESISLRNLQQRI